MTTYYYERSYKTKDGIKKCICSQKYKPVDVKRSGRPELKVSEEIKNDIINQYINGTNISYMCKRYGLSRYIIKKICN